MKCEIMKKTNFTLNLKKEDTIAFAYLAAERGITPEQLLESFVRDIVSSFSFDEINSEQSCLADWFNSCWFSQDNDGYFSFLQYVLLSRQYENINCLISEIKSSGVKKELLNLFNEYCIKNPAHKSFGEEIKIIYEFGRKINC